MRAVLDRSLPEPALPGGLTVGPPRFEDLHDVGELMIVAYAGSTDDDTPEGHRGEAACTFTGIHGAPQFAASVLAHDATGLVGASIVTLWKGRPLLAHLIVDPRWRGHGVGGALAARTANLLRAAGHPDWTLAVTHGNPAQHLYERLGFRRDESLRSN